MKTFFIQIKSLTLVALALTAFAFVSCNDDDPVTPPLKEQLVGTWDVTSYKLGGDEYMGFIFEAASIRFDAYTGAEGQFLQEVTFPDEESTSITGGYSFNEAAKKVTMEYDGQTILASIDIVDEDTLKWDGSQDGFPLVIEATRRD